MPQVEGATIPGPAMPPGMIREVPSTLPNARATQMADHQSPGPGRRIFSKTQAVSNRTRALRATSTPIAICSEEA